MSVASSTYQNAAREFRRPHIGASTSNIRIPADVPGGQLRSVLSTSANTGKRECSGVRKTISSSRISRRSVLSTAAAIPLLSSPLLRSSGWAQGTDSLPSWNDGATKQAIIEFVHATTDASSPKFVPQEARIATFDQDGTLWVEQPMYTQVTYCLERVTAPLRGQACVRSNR